MSKKIAILFPGQGSQYVGMGKSLYESDNQARTLFDQAEEVTGLPLKRLCFEGPMEELTQTVNLQPAVTTLNMALFNTLVRAGVQPSYVAGHSLGEYSALYAAGSAFRSRDFEGSENAWAVDAPGSRETPWGHGRGSWPAHRQGSRTSVSCGRPRLLCPGQLQYPRATRDFRGQSRGGGSHGHRQRSRRPGHTPGRVRGLAFPPDERGCR